MSIEEQPEGTPHVTAGADEGASRRDRARCACTLTAAVEAFGVLDRGIGAVSVQHNPPGGYQVTFDRDVTQAVYVATIGMPGRIVPMPPGEITVMGGPAPDAVSVFTHSSTGVRSDLGFHLAVHCPE
jgi:hypothetical protein